MKPPIDLHQLFETHGVFVSRLARAMVADEHAAEDLALETWAAVVHRPPVGVRNVRAWLTTILQRRVGDHRRRTRKSIGIDSAEFAASSAGAMTAAAADEAAQQLEVEHMLQTAVRALDEPYRSTIYLRFHEGQPPRAIAARMGVPVKTVKTRLSRGLDRLREALDQGTADSTDPRRSWRLALAPVAGLPTSAADLAASASTVHSGGATLSLLLGMKKLIVAAAALLLVIGLFSRFSPLSDHGTVPGISAAEELKDASSAVLATADAGLAEPEASSSTRGEIDTGTRALAAGPAAGSADELVDGPALATLVVEVKNPDGTREAGRPILLKASPWMNGGQPPLVRRTDREGRASFRGLEASSYMVNDTHGRADEWLDLEAGETKTLHWTTEGEVVIRGRVLDYRGDPVDGADIWCAASTESGKMVWRVQVADTEGRFEVRCSTDSGLQATIAGVRPGKLQPVQALVEVEPGVREVELFLGQPGSVLAGRVVDITGEPVAGAQVVIEVVHPKSVISQADGRFEVPGALPVGDFPVVVRAAGFAPNVTSVRVEGSGAEVEFVLHRGVEVSGTVLSPDGSPVSKAHVWIASPASRWQEYGHGPGASTRADDEGRYLLRRVAPGTVALRAQAGWADALSRGEAFFEVTDHDERNRDLQLAFGRTISGRTVDNEGLPVGGVVVTAFSGSVRSKDTRSAADGYFRLAALAAPEGGANGNDEWEVVARAWTGTSLRTLGTLEGIEPNGEDVELVVERIEEATATIVGRIEADTSPIPGDVQAKLFDEGGRGGGPLPFDRDTGAFTKGPLRPGTYRIELSRGGITVGTKSGLVVAAGDTVDAGVIRVGHGGSVEVRPLLPVGQSVAPDELQTAKATLVGPGEQQVTLEWRDGAWRSHGLLEPGTWRLRLLVDGVALPGREITIQSGEATRTEIAVPLD